MASALARILEPSVDWVANFTALPVWAQVLAIITFAASAGVFIVVTRLGISVGRSGIAQTPAPAAQVAAVIVDPTALNAAAGEVAGLTIAVTEGMAVVRAHTAAIDRQTDRIDQLADGMGLLRDQLIRIEGKIK